MLRSSFLTAAFVVASSAMTLVHAAPVAAQTYSAPAPMSGLPVMAPADPAMYQPRPPAAIDGDLRTAIWRATDDWDNAWQGWEIDSGGPAILLQRR